MEARIEKEIFEGSDDSVVEEEDTEPSVAENEDDPSGLAPRAENPSPSTPAKKQEQAAESASRAPRGSRDSAKRIESRSSGAGLRSALKESAKPKLRFHEAEDVGDAKYVAQWEKVVAAARALDENTEDGGEADALLDIALARQEEPDSDVERRLLEETSYHLEEEGSRSLLEEEEDQESHERALSAMDEMTKTLEQLDFMLTRSKLRRDEPDSAEEEEEEEERKPTSTNPLEELDSLMDRMDAGDRMLATVLNSRKRALAATAGKKGADNRLRSKVVLLGSVVAFLLALTSLWLAYKLPQTLPAETEEGEAVAPSEPVQTEL